MKKIEMQPTPVIIQAADKIELASEGNLTIETGGNYEFRAGSSFKILSGFIKGLFLFIAATIISCEFGAENDISLWIFRTKSDYSDKVSVELSPDKTRITSFYGPQSSSYTPIRLINGYLIGGVIGGINAGFLSITMEEYHTKYEVAPDPDTLYKLLIDKDPFTDFYTYNYTKRKNIFYTDNGLDTAQLNKLIRDGELEKYFAKLK